MNREIVINNKKISYGIRYSRRVQSIQLTIHPDKGLIVTVGSAWYERLIENFLRQKSAWLLKHLEKVKKSMDGKTVIHYSKEAYEQNKNKALSIVTERVEFFNALYKFRYKKISIRNQRSLWGSCTKSGNLQFNYKLIYLPKQTLDYVVVHELCHLKEHNHGLRFWNLVEKVIPEYKTIRSSLRQYVMKEK